MRALAIGDRSRTGRLIRARTSILSALATVGVVPSGHAQVASPERCTIKYVATDTAAANKLERLALAIERLADSAKVIYGKAYKKATGDLTFEDNLTQFDLSSAAIAGAGASFAPDRRSSLQTALRLAWNAGEKGQGFYDTTWIKQSRDYATCLRLDAEKRHDTALARKYRDIEVGSAQALEGQRAQDAADAKLRKQP